MNVLVTGADGFVGSWLVPALAARGHRVVAAVRADLPPVKRVWLDGAEEVGWYIGDATSVRPLIDRPLDAIVHLAAVASGGDALKDPATAWDVNTTGTARLAEVVAQHHGGVRGPLVLLVSSAEVYGVGAGHPRTEGDALLPVSPYAASKAGAEMALSEVGRRTGLRTMVARAFAHTGPRQDARFVIPAFAKRITGALRSGAASVPVGNLSPVRDILDVRDVVDAYARLLERGTPGEVYNVASGTGRSLADIFQRLAVLAGWRGRPEPADDLLRPTDIPHLVGDAARLRGRTGWQPTIPFDETLTEVLRAQAD
ncbi:MAG TPA: GDP-mannose 4,6-dehydratase [Gemmatimonadales bacterium]